MKALPDNNFIYTVEVDGDWNDYADCFFTVIAKSIKEARDKAKDRTNKKIIRIY